MPNANIDTIKLGTGHASVVFVVTECGHLGMGSRLAVTSGISGCGRSTGETIKWHGFQTPFKIGRAQLIDMGS